MESESIAGGPILVIGAGAIGGVLGGLLARSGRRIVFLMHGEEAARRIRAEGLRVSGVRGAMHHRAGPRNFEEPLPGIGREP